MSAILDALTPLHWLIGASALVSIVLVVRFWPVSEVPAMRVALLLTLIVPVIGPVIFWMLMIWPESQGEQFMDHFRNSADVTGRWRHVFEEKDPQKRKAKWREMTGQQHLSRSERRMAAAARKRKKK